jgi:hypothetical protein
VGVPSGAGQVVGIVFQGRPVGAVYMLAGPHATVTKVPAGTVIPVAGPLADATEPVQPGADVVVVNPSAEVVV